MITDEWVVTLDQPYILATPYQHAEEYDKHLSHDFEYSSVFYILVSSPAVPVPLFPCPPLQWVGGLLGVWPQLSVWPLLGVWPQLSVWPPLQGVVVGAAVMVWGVWDQR